MTIDHNILENLRDHGFIIEKRNIEKLSLADIKNDRLRFLSDYLAMNFKFAKFPDEMIIVKSNKISGDLFGQTCYGPLILSADGKVHLISTEIPNVFKRKIIIVNSKLDNFVRCYSLYISALYELRAEFDDLENSAIVIAKNFLKKASSIDPHSVKKYSFWAQYAFLLEELQAVFTTPWAEYIKTGRLAS